MARKTNVNRRGFLSSVAAASGGAVAAVVPKADAAEQKPKAAPPTAAATAADTEPRKRTAPSTANDCGSDFMVDVLEAIGTEHVFSNTAAGFLGLQESVINYAGNTSPEFITCMHEESSVAMAHGYYKACGKPAAVFAQATVGTQHAAMAIYNAFCDRAPMMMFFGNTLDATGRSSQTDWRHSAIDPVSMVRDFTKWDDQPVSLQHFAESVVRGHRMAMTPCMGPVAISVDSDMQEAELHDRSKLHIPRVIAAAPPVGDYGAVREAARLLATAERPVIVVDRMARDQSAMDNMVVLAELLNAPVIDQTARQNFPNTHYLWQVTNGPRLLRQADVVIGIELTDFWGTVTQFVREEALGKPKIKAGAKLINLGVNEMNQKPNNQYFNRIAEADITIVGDGQATLPFLIESVRALVGADRKSAIAARADEFRKAHAGAFEASRQAAALGWDASPITTARMCMELWQQVKNEDWAVVSTGTAPFFFSNWLHRLWNVDKQYRFLGVSGGGGVGYGLPAAVGAALANKALGRFSINLQCDGDFMYANGALWTAAHHKIPLLTVMHNNRAYGQETMNIQRLANHRNRGVANGRIGTEIDNPPINYAKLAQSMGVHGEGPIMDPKDLAGAYKRAIATVKQGLPALVDVVTQLR